MNSKNPTFQHIINAYPKVQADQIEFLYQMDPIFREICEDYAECIRMRDRYASDTTDRDAHQYRQEYEVLIDKLGEEMLAKFLVTQQTDNAPGEDRNLASQSSNQNTDLNNKVSRK